MGAEAVRGISADSFPSRLFSTLCETVVVAPAASILSISREISLQNKIVAMTVARTRHNQHTASAVTRFRISRIW